MGEQQKQIQWFPGHMAKTRRLISEHLKLVDTVVEICDARIPYSSRNPEIDRLLGNKPRLIILNKADLADEQITEKWRAYYAKKNIPAISVDCKTGRGTKQILPAAKGTVSELLTRRKNKGIQTDAIKLMIVGIPNVGKSTLINRLTGSNKTKTENRPGVTKAKQWVSLPDGSSMLDTPGVLWPKFEDQTVGLHLAVTGAIKDQILDTEELAMSLLSILRETARESLCSRYNLDPMTDFAGDSFDLLECIGRKRGMLVSGGHVDTERCAMMLLEEYRSSRLGRISLEQPKEL